MSDRLFPLREAVNVADLKARDRLVRRTRKIRAEAVQTKNDIQYWNSLHPDEAPIGTEFEDKVIAWCDGTGPEPSLADVPGSNKAAL